MSVTIYIVPDFDPCPKTSGRKWKLQIGMGGWTEEGEEHILENFNATKNENFNATVQKHSSSRSAAQ